MIVFEEILRDLERLYEKEKSLRKRVYLEKAINALKDYEKLI